MEADKIRAACARKFRSCCSPGRLPRPRTQRNVWRRQPWCPVHPDADPGSRVRTRQPLPNLDTDLPRRLRRCGPSGHHAQCQPSEKRSIECQWRRLPKPRHETPFQARMHVEAMPGESRFFRCGSPLEFPRPKISGICRRDFSTAIRWYSLISGVSITFNNDPDLAPGNHVFVVGAPVPGPVAWPARMCTNCPTFSSRVML